MTFQHHHRNYDPSAFEQYSSSLHADGAVDTDDYYDAANVNSYTQILRHRLSQPSTTITAVAVILAAIYNLYASYNPRAPPLHKVLWHSLVFVTPVFLLVALDNLVNPPMFPRPQHPLAAMSPATHEAKSDVMKQVFGLTTDPAAAVTTAQGSSATTTTGLMTGLQKSLRRSHVDTPAGLGNIDNSCFQNSVLQGLASLQTLPAYLAGPTLTKLSDDEQDSHQTPHKQPSSPPLFIDDETAGALNNFISSLNDTANNGRTLWPPPILKNLSTFQQQDAQEYFSKLLDRIDNSISKAAAHVTRLSQRGLEIASPSPTASDKSTTDSQTSDDSGYQSTPSSPSAKPSSPRRRSSVAATIPRNPLEGLIAQRVACTQCGHSDGLSMIPFNCLTLSLGLDERGYTLEQCLDAYSRVESIEGVDCAKCTLLKAQKLLGILHERSQQAGLPEDKMQAVAARQAAVETALEDEDFEWSSFAPKCNISAKSHVGATKTKQAAIARAPASLVVHVNRSVFDERTGMLFKNATRVNFPMELDLAPWCIGSSSSSSSSNSADADADADTDVSTLDEETWTLAPSRSMVAGAHGPSQLTGPHYRLRAVITHAGRHENGHYICFRAHSAATTPADAGNAAKWWRFSDENVREVARADVLAQGGVFMLFYDCVDACSRLRDSEEARSETRSETLSVCGSETESETETEDMPATVVQTPDTEPPDTPDTAQEVQEAKA